jgi:hypothetical protein
MRSTHVAGARSPNGRRVPTTTGADTGERPTLPDGRPFGFEPVPVAAADPRADPDARPFVAVLRLAVGPPAAFAVAVVALGLVFVLGLALVDAPFFAPEEAGARELVLVRAEVAPSEDRPDVATADQRPWRAADPRTGVDPPLTGGSTATSSVATTTVAPSAGSPLSHTLLVARTAANASP